jgi:hypothetical protein
MSATTTLIEQRVANGAAKLDEVKPDWYSLIDMDHLNMSYADQCILGQAFQGDGGYCNTLERMAWADHDEGVFDGDTSEYAVLHGFDLDEEEWGGTNRTTNAWNELALAWETEIQKRFINQKDNA